MKLKGRDIYTISFIIFIPFIIFYSIALIRGK